MRKERPKLARSIYRVRTKNQNAPVKVCSTSAFCSLISVAHTSCSVVAKSCMIPIHCVSLGSVLHVPHTIVLSSVRLDWACFDGMRWGNERGRGGTSARFWTGNAKRREGRRQQGKGREGKMGKVWGGGKMIVPRANDG